MYTVLLYNKKFLIFYCHLKLLLLFDLEHTRTHCDYIPLIYNNVSRYSTNVIVETSKLHPLAFVKDHLGIFFYECITSAAAMWQKVA